MSPGSTAWYCTTHPNKGHGSLTNHESPLSGSATAEMMNNRNSLSTLKLCTRPGRSSRSPVFALLVTALHLVGCIWVMGLVYLAYTASIITNCQPRLIAGVFVKGLSFNHVHLYIFRILMTMAHSSLSDVLCEPSSCFACCGCSSILLHYKHLCCHVNILPED